MTFRCGRVLLGFSVLLLAPAAQAGGELGANGSEITTSRYSVDLYQTAVWAGSKVTSLGGSYVALAYDVDGMLQNPAAPAVRPFFSVTDFDYWLGFGVTFPSSLTGMDFFNSGSETVEEGAAADSLIYLTPAAILQFGNFGFGVNLELQSYGMTPGVDSDSERLSVAFNQAHIQAAYSFFRGELVAGLGLRLLNMEARVGQGTSRSVPLSADGVGAEFGVLWQPKGQYFSVGAAFRSGITATAEFPAGLSLTSEGDVVFEGPGGDVYLPESAKLPWDLHLGVVYNFGGAPANQPWRSESTVVKRRLLVLALEATDLETEYEGKIAAARTEEERDVLEKELATKVASLKQRIARAKEDGYWQIQDELARRSRNIAMITVSVLMAGAVDNAVGVESLRHQVVNRSGQWLVASPRIGSEVEVIPDWVRLRSGFYLEPTRFETSDVRPHYTGGFDLALGVWNVFGLWPDDYRWRLGAGADIARDFQTIGVTAAGWYPRHRGKAKRPSDPGPLER
jgi:hypothetical protein